MGRSAPARRGSASDGGGLASTAARYAAVVLGIPLVVAAVFKALDPWGFLASLNAYGVPGWLRLPVVFLLPAVELAVGSSLVAGWRRRAAAVAAAVLVAVFIGAIGYGVWLGSLEECGCFGPFLERSPGTAFAQDLVLLLLAGIVVFGGRPGARLTVGRSAVLGVLVALSLAVTGYGYAVVPSSGGAVASGSAAQLESGSGVDLERGEHLLFLFHPDCPHCAEMAPRVVAYAGDRSLPPVTGVTTNATRAQIDGYLRRHDLDIPVLRLGSGEFLRITGTGSVPQLVHVRQGEVQRSWRGRLPSRRGLRDALGPAS